MPPTCYVCGAIVRPFTGQITADTVLCRDCIDKAAHLAPASALGGPADDDDDEPGDEDATPLERDVAVYEVPLTDPLGSEQARVDAGYDIGGEGG